jgi:hypothetical protein
MSGKINQHSTPMNPDDIAADLPAPRDDEPESLRRDIVDELADHLQCALQRELLASSNQQASGRRQPADTPETNTIEQTARQQVLTRFGNPASIARRLWFDAMKERLMAQKITATMATLAAGACIVMAVLVWQSTLRDSDAQQQLLLAQQELNRTLLAELKSLQQASSTAAATTAGWAPVKVRLQSEAGEPIAGRVGIQGTAINAGNDNAITVYEMADEEGLADFGLLPFGNYTIDVVATAIGEEHQQSLMLSPNTPPELTIICPAEPPPAVKVSFAIDVPPPLHADRLVFMAMLQRPSRRTSSGSWYPEDESDRSFTVLFDAEGTILGEMNKPTQVVSQNRTTLPGGYFADVSGGFGRGSSSDVDVIQFELVPARTIRSTDRCIGLQVAARVADAAVDDSTLRLALAPVAYTAEVVQSDSFPDTDPDEEAMRIAFDLPSSTWDEVVAAFRHSNEVADVTIPDGWQVVKLSMGIQGPVDPITGRYPFDPTTRRLQSERARNTPRTVRPIRLEVRVTLPDNSILPVGVGDAIRFSSVSHFDLRDARNRERPLEVDVLAPPELADAIELAGTLGDIKALRFHDDRTDEAELGVNHESLGIMRDLAAVKAAENTTEKNE